MRLLSAILASGEQLLAMSQPEVGRVILEAIRQDPGSRGLYHVQELRFHPNGARDPDIEQAILEGWAWLSLNLLLLPSGDNGWMRLSRRGRLVVQSPAEFDQVSAHAILAGDLLHPEIRNASEEDLLRGRFDEAIMAAFRRVEIAVRSASGYAKDHVGVPLMRDAFHPKNGPLTDGDRSSAEREGDAALFAGAFGAYRNSSTHNETPTLARECARLLVLASILLADVERRSAQN